MTTLLEFEAADIPIENTKLTQVSPETIPSARPMKKWSEGLVHETRRGAAILNLVHRLSKSYSPHLPSLRLHPIFFTVQEGVSQVPN